MTVKMITAAATEADLEARLGATLRKAFGWLPPESLRHQTKFAFKFGHRSVEIDGTMVSQIHARSDILVFLDDKPLAVVELKRESVELTADDSEQGLSYARMLYPHPPLVVVTNGHDQIILETHTGKKWAPETPSEQALQKLIESAGKIATADRRHAVEVLLGPSSTVWANAIRSATRQTLDDMTGEWADFDKPFVKDFLIPRSVTKDIINSLSSENRIIILNGPPFSGKSNVLRELSEFKDIYNDIVIFYIEADSQSSTGLIESIALVLETELGWRISRDDTHSWLSRLSKQEGPTLVLAIDGLSHIRDSVRRDIDELSSMRYGNKLKLLVAIDDTLTDILLKNETGRKDSRIGRRSEILTVPLLTHYEFREMLKCLENHRFIFMPGAQYSIEYRNIWLLRALISNYISDLNYVEKKYFGALPSLMGTELLTEARKRFEAKIAIRDSYKTLAKAFLDDILHRIGRKFTVFQSLDLFFIRKEILKKYFNETEIDKLIINGNLKLSINKDNLSIFSVRIPELLASEIALQLGEKLSGNLTEPDKAVFELVNCCRRIPMGDVIGAQALIDCAAIQNELPVAIIQHLINMRPSIEKLRPGMKLSMKLSDMEYIDIDIQQDGTVLVHKEGVPIAMHDISDFADGSMYGNMDGWLILSHVSGQTLTALSAGGRNSVRIDPYLLTEIGSLEFVLRKNSPEHEIDMNTLPLHTFDDVEIICTEAGIVEPITFSIYKFLSREGTKSQKWLDEAINRNSLPLLARINLALRLIAPHAEDDNAGWAIDMLRKYVEPALAAFPQNQ